MTRSPPLLSLLLPLPFLLLLLLRQPTAAVAASPLFTDSRWIVDGGGRRVKLACVNWAAHLDPVVAEGLGKQPLDAISGQIRSMGFNCVRLTWPLYLLTNSNFTSGGLTVRQSLRRIGLADAAAGVAANNPALADLTLVQAFQAVVWSLARNEVMVILDNQITTPGWCCSRYDGNGFFGDQFFDPDEWMKGLTVMATMFKGSTHVVGMSLRNELRGPRQNVTEWYRYMQRGAEAVHSANPDLLVILSGLDYDKDLSFLSEKQVDLTFKGKLVFELHWYGFSDGGDWKNGNPNEVCGAVLSRLSTRGGFLLQQGWPLFLGEFGIDLQSSSNEEDNRFLSCLLGVAADWDLDWALWALQGSYYIREGIREYDETYGVLTSNWSSARNSRFLQRIQSLQSPFQGPGLSGNIQYKMLFHPLTGLCVLRNTVHKTLELGPCAKSEAWSYDAEQRLGLVGAELCVRAVGVGMPAEIAVAGCGGSDAAWDRISDSKMHLAAVVVAGNSTAAVCLDVDSNGTVVTCPCKCLNGTEEQQACDPLSQWFKIVSSTRSLVGGKLPDDFAFSR